MSSSIIHSVEFTEFGAFVCVAGELATARAASAADTLMVFLTTS